VFMIGGGNYLERETLAAWASRSTPPRQVRLFMYLGPNCELHAALCCMVRRRQLLYSGKNLQPGPAGATTGAVGRRIVRCMRHDVVLLGGGNYLERETLAAWASRSTPPRQVRWLTIIYIDLCDAHIFCCVLGWWQLPGAGDAHSLSQQVHTTTTGAVRLGLCSAHSIM
jgi:hypothetical protein